MYLGAILTTDYSIAANKPYVFIYSTYSREATIRKKLNDLAAYAGNIAVVKSGLTATITLTPLYAMKLSVWRDLFKNIGLSDLKDIYSGAPAGQKDEGFTPLKNIQVFWGPKIKSAADTIGSGLSGAFDYIKWVAIAGAVIVGGVVVLTYLPKPRYKENPKRRRSR